MKDKRNNQRTRKNIKKYMNAKFDYAKFVKNYYMENGEAYISLKVNCMDDIISKYSIDGYEWINLEFAEYIEEYSYYIPVEESITLEICGGNFSEEQKEKITTIIRDYYGLQLGDKIMDLHTNRRRANMLLGLGIITLLGLFIFNNVLVERTLMEVIFIAVWFFLWEYADMALIDRTELMTKKVEAGQLAVMKIKFLD